MKKIIALLLTVAMVCGSLVGCGAGKTADTTKGLEKQEVVDDHEPVTLRILTRWTGTDSMTPLLQEIKSSFEEKYPWITIQDDSVNEESAYLNVLNTAIATGDMPNIFYIPTVMGGLEYAKSGILMDVSPLFEDKEWYEGFNEGVFSAFDFSDMGVEGYYGVPFSVGVEGIYYNKKLFAQAGIDKVPETMEEMYDAIDKLKAIDVVPFAVGADETWRAGHILNWMTYKTAGVQKTIDIGLREAKWTDPEMVQSLQNYLDLKNAGAFQDNYEGVTYEEEQNLFFSGKAAMDLNGTWFMGNCADSEIADDIGIFAPPYFKDKQDLASNGIIYPQAFCLDGTCDGAEKEAQILFIKHMTSKEFESRMANEVNLLPTRGDVDISEISSDSMFYQAMDIAKTLTLYSGDTTDYDPLTSMNDFVRNTLIGMSLGQMTPEEAAKAIQDEIDSNN